MPRTLAVMFGLLVVALVPSSTSAQTRLARVATAATLSILAGDVRHVPARDGARRPVEHGMDLADGDRVVTGPTGLALITFLDGTTITVQPGSDVVVRQADVTDARAGRIAIFVSLGTVWARIAARLGSRRPCRSSPMPTRRRRARV